MRNINEIISNVISRNKDGKALADFYNYNYYNLSDDNKRLLFKKVGSESREFITDFIKNISHFTKEDAIKYQKKLGNVIVCMLTRKFYLMSSKELIEFVSNMDDTGNIKYFGYRYILNTYNDIDYYDLLMRIYNDYLVNISNGNRHLIIIFMDLVFDDVKNLPFDKLVEFAKSEHIMPYFISTYMDKLKNRDSKLYQMLSRYANEELILKFMKSNMYDASLLDELADRVIDSFDFTDYGVLAGIKNVDNKKIYEALRDNSTNSMEIINFAMYASKDALEDITNDIIATNNIRAITLFAADTKDVNTDKLALAVIKLKPSGPEMIRFVSNVKNLSEDVISLFALSIIKINPSSINDLLEHYSLNEEIAKKCAIELLNNCNSDVVYRFMTLCSNVNIDEIIKELVKKDLKSDILRFLKFNNDLVVDYVVSSGDKELLEECALKLSYSNIDEILNALLELKAYDVINRLLVNKCNYNKDFLISYANILMEEKDTHTLSSLLINTWIYLDDDVIDRCLDILSKCDDAELLVELAFRLKKLDRNSTIIDKRIYELLPKREADIKLGILTDAVVDNNFEESLDEVLEIGLATTLESFEVRGNVLFNFMCSNVGKYKIALEVYTDFLLGSLEESARDLDKEYSELTKGKKSEVVYEK